MRVLQLTIHFFPNVGGVETHLDDLVKGLSDRKHQVFVLTYRPLMNKTSWKIWEKRGRVSILRVPWFSGFFYKLVKNPILEFLYLLPGLFFVAPFVILFTNPDVIQSHGLVAGFIGVFWGKAFGKRVVVSTHSIYHFPKSGLYSDFVLGVFKRADKILTLSKQSASEVESLGIRKDKIQVFRYWVDLTKFKPIKNAKRLVGWENKFVVLFVGRLVEEKGILVLLESLKKWNRKIYLAIAGAGPLERIIMNYKLQIPNLIYLGRVDQDKLPLYYSAVDLVIVPSIHEEGFGRVILESLACETPVIAANRGAIPEAMDETVGKLIEVSPENIRKEVEYFYSNREKLKLLNKETRSFAIKHFSNKNIQDIISAYG